MAESMSQQYDQVLVDIADYVYHYQIKESKSFERARHLLLDTFGCAIESLNDASLLAIIGPHVKGTLVPDGFRLLGTALQLDPVKGAFDFGAMIRYLDHNDALSGVEWGHPSDNLGAIVPVMDWLSRASTHSADRPSDAPSLTIKTLLIAMIKAYEIQGCFQIANSFNAFAIDHTILIKIASTAVLAWLIGLPEHQCLAVLSQAFMDGHPLRTFRAAPNTVPRKGWAAGDACMRAVHLCLLVRAGQPGAPQPLTAPRWGFYTNLFGGKTFSMPVSYGESIIHRAVLKLIACEGHGLTAAEASLNLHRMLHRQGLDAAQDIVKIEIRTHRPALIIIDKTGNLVNAADRDHCMQYIVAVTLLKGEQIEYADYLDTSSWASDSQVVKLREKMTLSEDKEFTKAYYNYEAPQAPTGIRLLLKDGTWTNEVVVRIPFGAPGASESLDGINIESKFEKNMRSKYTEQEVRTLKDALLENELPIHNFIDKWWRP